MSDFMNRSDYRPPTIEDLRGANDALNSALADVIRQRDDARLEADRLRGEVARLAKERDEATAAENRLRQLRLEAIRERDDANAVIRDFREAVLGSAAPLQPCQDVAKTIERLEKITGIIGQPAAGVPGDAEVRLAQVGMIAARMLGALKG